MTTETMDLCKFAWVTVLEHPICFSQGCLKSEMVTIYREEVFRKAHVQIAHDAEPFSSVSKVHFLLIVV